MSARVVWAFDFDGVIVDSARETGMAAVLACNIVFSDNIPIGGQHYYALLDKFLIVRPCLETGWEAILMIHLLHQGADAHMVLEQFQPILKQEALQGYGLSEDTLKATLQKVRDDWIARDAQDWFQAHGFYKDSVEALRRLAQAATAGQDVQVFIITTKSKDLTLRLLAECSVEVPESRVYGLGSGKKADILQKLLTEQHAAKCAFVEDRLETLIAVHEREPLRARVKLLLANWGYNIEADWAKAKKLEMTVLSPADLLRIATEDPHLDRDGKLD